MKRRFTAAAVIIAALSVPLSAQWPRRSPPGVPKSPDGKVNLLAPTPRTADGKPDLSGIWEVSPRRETPGSAPPGRPPLALFANLAANIKEGLPFQPWASELSKKRVANQRYDNPDALCLPQGPLQYHLDPQPRQIYQMPGRTLIVYESNYGLRTIYTDGRPLPPLGEPQPYWLGYSIGHWEGDTFVVESNNFRGVEGGNPSDAWLADRAVPAPELRKPGDRRHDRRSEGLHEAFHRKDRAAGRGGRLGNDRIHLPREPEVPRADRSGRPEINHGYRAARAVSRVAAGWL